MCPRTITKKGRIISWPVRKVLPNGVVQLEGRPYDLPADQKNMLRDIRELRKNKLR